MRMNDPYARLAKDLEEARSRFSSQIAVLEDGDEEFRPACCVLESTADILEELDLLSDLYGKAWMIRSSGMSVAQAAEHLHLKRYVSKNGNPTYMLWKLSDLKKGIKVWLNEEGPWCWGASIDGELVKRGTDEYRDIEGKVRDMLGSVGYVMP